MLSLGSGRLFSCLNLWWLQGLGGNVGAHLEIEGKRRVLKVARIVSYEFSTAEAAETVIALKTSSKLIDLPAILAGEGGSANHMK